MATATTDPLTNPADLNLIVHAVHWDPFSILGPHEIDGNGRPGLVIRAFLPEARHAWVIDLTGGEPGVRVPMERVHPDGFFERYFPGGQRSMPYRLAVEDHQGHGWDFVDPYRFGPVLSDFDLHLLGGSIVGQCLHYHHSRHIIPLLVGEEESAAYTLDRLTEHLVRFSLAAIRGMYPQGADGFSAKAKGDRG